jgi:hypothetical protein
MVLFYSMVAVMRLVVFILSTLNIDVSSDLLFSFDYSSHCYPSSYYYNYQYPYSEWSLVFLFPLFPFISIVVPPASSSSAASYISRVIAIISRTRSSSYYHSQ